MSGSGKTGRFLRFVKNESGWADFFITRIGLIMFAALLMLSAFKIYPMYEEREKRFDLDAIASDISSKIEAVDSMTIPGYKYSYDFDGKSGDIKIEISSEYIIAHKNISNSMSDERELIHPEPVITHVYPPNGNWSNTSGFRKYVSDLTGGKNGDPSNPLDLNTEKAKVDMIFESARKELARHPFSPDPGKPLFIEKVIIYYKDQNQVTGRDYVFVYQ